MIDGITRSVEGKATTKTGTSEARTTATGRAFAEAGSREKQPGYTKVFRWPVPAGQMSQPSTIEVIGSFSGWRRIPLSYDLPTRTWQIILDNVESNRTHRYVVLVDGKPSYDRTCDGLTAPQTPEEARWEIATPKGPRVMLLFGQTK